MMLLLKCPKCKNDMKYQSTTAMLGSKRKRCVYCGHSYKISERIVKKVDK